MGIFCEINLNKSSGGVFYGGDPVSGIIKYVLDEPLEIDKITISLKGIGSLLLTETVTGKNITYTNSEVLVDTDEIVQAEKCIVPVGTYEWKFNFMLPSNIPASFRYKKFKSGYNINCKIKYYIRIRFDRPGWLGVTKHFRKKINVTSTITPKLPMEPTIHGERKKLLQPFSSKTSTVTMKASVVNSVIPNGGKIEIQSEILNDTKVIAKSVQTKLIAVLVFKAKGLSKLKVYETVPNCEFKTASIQCGAAQNMPIEITVPSDVLSLENSKIISRDYIVRIVTELPMPHRNVVLEIPVQIGDDVRREDISDAPPTYWEAMGEINKEDDASDDEALDDGEPRGYDEVCGNDEASSSGLSRANEKKEKL